MQRENSGCRHNILDIVNGIRRSRSPSSWLTKLRIRATELIAQPTARFSRSGTGQKRNSEPLEGNPLEEFGKRSSLGRVGRGIARRLAAQVIVRLPSPARRKGLGIDPSISSQAPRPSSTNLPARTACPAGSLPVDLRQERLERHHSWC